MRARIGWRKRDGGETHYGNYMDARSVEAWAAKLNHEYPQLLHWVEYERKRAIVIEFPLPPRELSANPSRGGAWRKKAKAAKEYKACCCDAAIYARIMWGAEHADYGAFPLTTRATLHLDFYYGKTPTQPGLYRARDEANALYSFKAGQDALVAAGILVDDNAKWLKMGEVVIYSAIKDHKGKAVVVATLEWETEDGGRIKYLLFDGYVGTNTRVRASQLIGLYGLDPRECIVVRDENSLRGLRRSEYEELYPRPSGRYRKDDGSPNVRT